MSVGCAWTWPGAFPETDPVAVLVRYNTPNSYRAVVAWYYVAPGVAAFLAGQFLISTSRIWFARMGVSLGLRSRLPKWPLSPTADGPAIVVGEVHHPVKAIESPAPEWLTIPERGLYTGVAIFGAVGSGKTSACMHPFARQLLSWQAKNPERRSAALKYLKDHKIKYDRERFESATAMEIRLRVEAVNRWYVHDWNTLDNKIRSSIVEGVSVFLSMFDLPSVARVFCPPAPEARQRRGPGEPNPTDAAGNRLPVSLAGTTLSGDLPPLDALIESGKVLSLNMPAGTNPALARAVGVMLKNAWLQSLLRRPATMKNEPGRYFRPAVFICDE